MPLTSHRDIPGLIGPILATLLVVPTGVPAAGGTPAEQEIEALQRQVRELQERVNRLEAKMA
mgnify:FL=1